VAGANRLRIDSTGLVSIPKWLTVGGSQLLANITVKGDPAASGAIMMLDGNANNGYISGAGIDGSYSVTRFVSGAYTSRLSIDSTGVVNAVTALQVNSRPVIMAGCRVYHNTVNTCATGTAVMLAFNSERFDTDGYHDTVTNNSRLTVPTGLAGTYLITAVITFAASMAGMREVALKVNNATYIAIDDRDALSTAGLTTSMTMMATWVLAAGDYVQVQVYQNSGGNLDVIGTSAHGCEFAMQRIG
jgi:hypothetical protein